MPSLYHHSIWVRVCHWIVTFVFIILAFTGIEILKRIVVTDEFDDFGENGAIPNGWAWYVGI